VTDAYAAIVESRLVPVVRCASADEAMQFVDRLLELGLRVVELTATTAGWQDLLTDVTTRHPDVVVGLGTVTTEAVAEEAVDAGAAFVVTPYPAPRVRSAAEAAGMFSLEGGFSPAEMADVLSRGPAKLFPASLGGPAYLRSLLSLMPDAQIVPTGGIRLEEVASYLAAGAIAVGVGTDLARGDAAERLSLLQELRA
jgi:2-dehydro-3-deoxyphosphogluconate aldolase/(4S)-4-hydroxy-2-oxoglutarate aldolase